MRKSEKILFKSIEAYRNGNINLAKLYNIVLRILFSCDIPYTVDIADSTQLVHNGLGCVFHPQVKINKNCKIYQNVTLGGNGKIIDNKEVNKGAPILEDNVTVFSGACVLGPITIGKNSIIGANAVVTKNVPENCIAVGIPAKIKPNNIEYNFNNSLAEYM